MASHAGIWLADATGPARQVGRAEAGRALADTPHLVLNAPLVAARLGIPECPGLDLLELFAFVHPARFVIPSAAGLARLLGLAEPSTPVEEARLLQVAAGRLLATLADARWRERAGAHTAAMRLSRRGWGWAQVVLAQLKAPAGREADLFDALPGWSETPPRPEPRPVVLTAERTGARLSALRGARREPRPGQEAYARALIPAFCPRESRDGPNLVVAEAGTGTGKTLGYLAPASLYAEESGGAVWLSTYTRALQRQLMAEVETSLPERLGGRPVAVRKGRENYLCLLNLEDAMAGQFSGRQGQFAELVARWARFTRDGDMVGGDLPGWLPALFRSRGALPALSDRRGECIRAACPHYRRCFIEKSVRGAAHASLVIANHALTLAMAARGGAEVPRRILFDEGHHLPEAADSAFSVALTGTEALELRRWILGPEGSGRRVGRRRGLAARLTDAAHASDAVAQALEPVMDAARLLAADQWLDRLIADEPDGPIEQLLAAVRTQVITRAPAEDHGFSLETEIVDLLPGLAEAADRAASALERLSRALARLRATLLQLLASLPDWLDASGVARLEAAEAGLADRIALLSAWAAMLARVGGSPEPDFVDWFALVKAGGRERDAGIFRHWLDPMKPLSQAVLSRAHGVVVTSATLADGDEPEPSLRRAGGAPHIPVEPRLFQVDSPFAYAEAARVFIATDVRPRDSAMLALAFAQLIEAAEGGALGLFTAIARLREVHARIADRLAARGLPLLAQHVDPVDTGTLVDLFRADPRASLLGTDALRDGVDVPGESLRLIIFEGIPWSRPTILESARRAAFGGMAHEDRQVRRRLAQAFGRLIRTQGDRGAFVLLGPQVPSRLLTAFPGGVRVERLPLDAVAERVAAFLKGDAAAQACKAEGAFLGDKGLRTGGE